MTSIKNFIAFSVLFALAAPVIAGTPPIWRDPIVNADPLVFGNGSGPSTADRALGFTFPFTSGGTTSTITIGTNGGIALASGEAIPADSWQNTTFESNFSAGGTPRISVFSTGLNHFNDTTVDVEGVYFFTDNTSRAYITWYKVAGGAITNAAIISAQIQLYSDGTIIFGYDVVDGANILAGLNNGIVVGITSGASVWPTGSSDFSILDTSDINAGPTTYQIWCQNGNAVNCFQQSGTDTHGNFDLDGKNIVFNPTPGAGYQVSNTVKSGEDKGVCISISSRGSNSISSSGSSGGGGGGGSFGIAFILLLVPLLFPIGRFLS